MRPIPHQILNDCRCDGAGAGRSGGLFAHWLLLAGFLPRLARMALAPLHAFELEPVGIEEKHRVVVVIVLARRIDDLAPQLLQEGLQVVDVLAAPSSKA